MNNKIFDVFQRAAKQRWLKWNKDSGLQAFIDTPGTESYLHSQYVDGHSELQRALSTKDVGKLTVNNLLIQVNTVQMDMEVSYAGLIEKEGESLDITISIAARIGDARHFLTDCGLGWAKTADSGGVSYIENLLDKKCKQPVTDELLTLLYEDLTQREALPTSWWQKKLALWFGCDWLELVEVKSVQYASATANKAKTNEQRQKMAALELDSQHQINAIELHKKQDQQAYEQAIEDITANQLISEQQREARLEQARLQCDKAVLQAQEELETIKLQSQKQRAELEVEIDRLNSREDMAAERLKQAEDSEKRTQEMLGVISTAKQQIEESQGILAAAMKEDLADAKRIGQYAGAVSSETMELLGRPNDAAYLSKMLKGKSDVTGGVKMKKSELRTRDIGTKRVESLAINTPLQFEFTTELSGYATLLNIGTSGTLWLHSPNAYIGIDGTKVKAGETYCIPGPLLPDDELSRNGLSYLEVGPPGWEELVVIVSPEPLATKADLFDSTEGSPFPAMSPDQIARIIDQLAESPEDAWSAGLLSFLVE